MLAFSVRSNSLVSTVVLPAPKPVRLHTMNCHESGLHGGDLFIDREALFVTTISGLPSDKSNDNA
jgi:hypothetical protein